jgi:signal peptidase I
MSSLSILAVLEIAVLLASSWAVTIAAKSVGSERGRFAVGCKSVVLLSIFSIVDLCCIALFARSPQFVLVSVAGAIVGLAGAYLHLRFAFRLSESKTFAPFGAYLATPAIIAVVTLPAFKQYIVEAFVVPTASMAPTIEPHDRFVVNKLLHPRRLDLIAYHSNQPQHPIYCKRLVGLPGEQLRFDNGNLYVNDQVVTLPAVVAGKYHARLMRQGMQSMGRYRDGDTILLGSDEYFVIGDNVDISLDSRLEGPSKGESIVGVVDFMYWPLSRFKIMRN